jgi:hypothetical protein
MGTYFVCLDIYGGQKHNVYFMTQIPHFSFMLTLMLPGPVILQIVAPSLVTVFFLDHLLLLGNPRSKLMYLDLVLKQNFKPWLLLFFLERAQEDCAPIYYSRGKIKGHKDPGTKHSLWRPETSIHKAIHKTGQKHYSPTAEIIWIRWLLADLGVSCDSPTLLRCDNTGAIQICHDPVKRELTKHIGVDVSFTRSHCHQKTIDLQYVPSELQLADFFTKAQTRAQHQFHLIKLNASNPPFPS